jgi:hypothetical protein
MNTEGFQRERYNPPASEEAIRKAAAKLGGTIQPELAELYRSYDGVSDCAEEMLFRLMPLDEVIEINERFSSGFEISEVLARHHLRWFWSDDESNYLGMFTDGALAGRISCFDHEGYYSGDVSPLFRSLDSADKQLKRLVEWNRIVDDEEGLEEEDSRLNREDFKYLAPCRCETAYFACLKTDYPDEVLRTQCDIDAYQWVRQKMEELSRYDEIERTFILLTYSKLAPNSDLEGLHTLLDGVRLRDPGQILHNLFLRGHRASIDPIIALATREVKNSSIRSSAIMTLAKWIYTGKVATDVVLNSFSASGEDPAEIQKFLGLIEQNRCLIYQW